MSTIGWEWYDDYDRHGTSKTVKWLRLGRGAVRLEIGSCGFFLRLGWLYIACSLSRGGEDV